MFTFSEYLTEIVLIASGCVFTFVISLIMTRIGFRNSRKLLDRKNELDDAKEYALEQRLEGGDSMPDNGKKPIMSPRISYILAAISFIVSVVTLFFVITGYGKYQADSAATEISERLGIFESRSENGSLSGNPRIASIGDDEDEFEKLSLFISDDSSEENQIIKALADSDWATAAKLADKVKEKQGTIAFNIHMLQGFSLFKDGRWQDAAGSYRNALKLKPNNVTGLNYLAANLLSFGNTKEANGVTQKAVEQSKLQYGATSLDHASTLANRGGLFLMMAAKTKDADEATKLFERVDFFFGEADKIVKQHPEAKIARAEMLVHKAGLSVMRRDWSAGIAYLESAAGVFSTEAEESSFMYLSCQQNLAATYALSEKLFERDSDKFEKTIKILEANWENYELTSKRDPALYLTAATTLSSAYKDSGQILEAVGKARLVVSHVGQFPQLLGSQNLPIEAYRIIALMVAEDDLSTGNYADALSVASAALQDDLIDGKEYGASASKLRIVIGKCNEQAGEVETSRQIGNDLLAHMPEIAIGSPTWLAAEELSR